MASQPASDADAPSLANRAIADGTSSREAYTLLQKGITHRDISLVRRALAAGADPDAPMLGFTGRTALTLALEPHDPPADEELVALLLASGARANSGESCLGESYDRDRSVALLCLLQLRVVVIGLTSLPPRPV